MPSNHRFPPSIEIKRVITAALRAGIEIGSIEIHPRKITIYPTAMNAAPITDYDVWKMNEGHETHHVRHADKQSDALPKKPRR